MMHHQSENIYNVNIWLIFGTLKRVIHNSSKYGRVYCWKRYLPCNPLLLLLLHYVPEVLPLVLLAIYVYIVYGTLVGSCVVLVFRSVWPKTSALDPAPSALDVLWAFQLFSFAFVA